MFRNCLRISANVCSQDTIRGLKDLLPKSKKVIMAHVYERSVPELDKYLLNHLEQISLLRFKGNDIANLKEDIKMANGIFNCSIPVDTEPLYSVIDEVICCKLREDVPFKSDKDLILKNSANVSDDYFVSPSANINLKPTN
uniref:Formylmethanofuran dehydrogenase n=1 Tax=Rhabditophanes sp. KR3021 TaxID=114890 RepID=A0AC35UGN0_9BILA